MRCGDFAEARGFQGIMFAVLAAVSARFYDFTVCWWLS